MKERVGAKDREEIVQVGSDGVIPSWSAIGPSLISLILGQRKTSEKGSNGTLFSPWKITLMILFMSAAQTEAEFDLHCEYSGPLTK